MPLFVPPPLQIPQKYLSGRKYSTYWGAGSLIVVPAVDSILLYPFPVEAPISVSSLILRTGAGGAGSSCKSAVWAGDPDTSKPIGAPLVVDNTGQSTTASSTTIVASVTPGIIPRGVNWVGVKFTGTLPTMLSLLANSQNFAFIVGAPDSSSYLLNMGQTFADAYANNMPTFTGASSFTPSSAGFPIVSLGIT